MSKSVVRTNSVLVVIIIAIASFLIAASVHAKTFKLNLYFDSIKNEIVLNRDAETKVVLTEEVFSEESSVPKDYYFKKVNFDGYMSYPFYFLPKDGEFVLSAPYFQENAKINIYHKDTLKLSVDVSQFATCNANNVCESSKSENAQNCIADCFALEVDKIKNNNYNNTNADQNLEPSDLLTGAKKDETANQTTTETRTPFFGLIVGSLMILGGAGYGVYALIRRRREDG